MSNLTKTLAWLSLLVPASGYSLGIGDLKLHSALNQNLDAEISLTVSTGDKASDINVNLAPPDKFDEAGIPWSTFLSRIKFETIVGANGSVIIKLSSKEAVKEPFLDFLLQVNWPKGSLYRQFTVLLDPPSAYKQVDIPTLANSESYKSEQSVSPDYGSSEKKQARTDKTINGSAEYGPTNRNDTLWKVAEQVGRPDGTSVEQMMMAIYNENPHAFYKENINRLLTGKKLKIPEREIVLRLSREQALTEFNRHTQAWRNRLEPAPVNIAPAKKEAPDKQLTLTAPSDADVDRNAIVAPEKEQVTVQKTVEAAIKPKIIEKELTSGIPPINDALQYKVAELEKQLAIMQQILALKDQQLASLQNQFQAKTVVKSEPAQATPAQLDTIKPAMQKPPQPVGKATVIKSVPEETSSSTIYYLFGGGAIIILFAWFWSRKRWLRERTNSSGLFEYPEISKAPEPKGFFSTSLEKDDSKTFDATGKRSFFSEFALGDFDAFDTDQSEIDPVSEADVYLAYGRYQQAEELMRDVIKDQPNRDDCKLKLLNIYYLNENKHAFEAYANELAKAGKKDDVDFWTKVAEMGHEICKDSNLFSSQGESIFTKSNSIFAKATTKLVEFYDGEKGEVPDVKENELSLVAFGESSDHKNTKEIPQAADNLLDFDLSSVEDDFVEKQQNNGRIDVDLYSEATKIESTGTLDNAISESPVVEVNDKLESFHFEDFDSNKSELKNIDEIDTRTEKSSMENSPLTDNLTFKSSGTNSSRLANKSLDRNFYFDKPLSGQKLDFKLQSGLDVYDLTDMDELETKLDLAKAYIDMSDKESARDMASEVLEKGTAEQKKIAQALLNDLK